MKLNRKFIKAVAVACIISLPGAVFAKPMTLPEFIISCLLPSGTIVCPDLPNTEFPDIKPPTTGPDVEIPEVIPPTEKPDTNLPGTGGPSSSFEKQVLDLVNKERTSRGLNPLQMHAKAQQVARVKSQDMQKNNYFSHTSPTYGSPFDMLKSFGVNYSMAGENIAQGYSTPSAVVEGWMNSQGHRENILNPNFTHLGVGYEPTGHYWTQMFIR
ncbi:MAG: CAP domain-containing protein [Cellulosilyticaceae bacterium]